MAIDTSVPYFETSWKDFVNLTIEEYNELSCYYDYDVKREFNKTIVFWTIKLKPGKEITEDAGLFNYNIPGKTNNH